MALTEKPEIFKLDEQPSLSTLQTLVGGLIQIVFDDKKIQIICNEEGKLLSMPINRKATEIWYNKLCESDREFVRANPDYMFDDFLCGNVVILEGNSRID